VSSILLIVVLIPLMTSVVARSYGWTVLLATNGVLNAIVEALGAAPLPLIYNRAGVVIALAEVLMPFMVLSLVSSLQHLEPSLEQAARSLGAPPWRVAKDIVVPLTLPGVAAGSLLVFVQAVSAFATPTLIGGPTTLVMATLVYDQAINVLNWPFASALSFILLAIVLLLTIAQGRLLRAEGSVAERHAI
jgi:putative spermidine/putrescine transport system permease protein